MQNDPEGRSQKAACRPQSTNQACPRGDWAGGHRARLTSMLSALLSGTLVPWTCPHLNNLGWGSADLLFMCGVQALVSDLDSQKELLLGHSSSDLFQTDVCSAVSHPQSVSFSPVTTRGACSDLFEQGVCMEHSGHRACDQHFNWSLVKGLLWSGISVNLSTRACAICSCGYLLLKCYFHYGVAIWMSYNNLAAIFFAPEKECYSPCLAPLLWGGPSSISCS